jgi:hypothetical protein
LVLAIAAGAGVIVFRPQLFQEAPAPSLVPPPEVAASPAPPPVLREMPAKPDSVKLSLVSDPPNAEVYNGAALLGRTPLMIDWARGTHADLKFVLEGYAPATRTIAPEGDTPLLIKLTRPATPRSRKKPEGAFDAVDDIKDNPFK